MSVYYVTHPNITTSARVEAPTTEKARTAFLDYLERQGDIYRADRQQWRRNMVAERMNDPEDVRADIDLTYGYAEMGYAPDFEFSSREETYREPEYETYEQPQTVNDISPDRAGMIQDVARETPRRLSPIQRRALRGYAE